MYKNNNRESFEFEALASGKFNNNGESRKHFVAPTKHHKLGIIKITSLSQTDFDNITA